VCPTGLEAGAWRSTNGGRSFKPLPIPRCCINAMVLARHPLTLPSSLRTHRDALHCCERRMAARPGVRRARRVRRLVGPGSASRTPVSAPPLSRRARLGPSHCGGQPMAARSGSSFR
jgi:hypothetical protein